MPPVYRNARDKASVGNWNNPVTSPALLMDVGSLKVSPAWPKSYIVPPEYRKARSFPPGAATLTPITWPASLRPMLSLLLPAPPKAPRSCRDAPSNRNARVWPGVEVSL